MAIPESETVAVQRIDLQTWNPYESCHMAGTFTGHRPLIYAEIVEGILALADVYSKLQGGAGSDVTATLLAIQDALVDIKYQLDQISNDLEHIQQLLVELPKEIKDIVSTTAFNGIMGGALALCGQVKDYSADDQVDNHQSELSGALRDLDQALGQIKGVKGVVGQYLAMPMVSIWLAGAVALERSRQRTWTGEGTYKPMSPWKRDTMIRSAEALATLYQQSEDLLKALENDELPNFPKLSWTLQVAEGPGGVRYFQNYSPTAHFVGAFKITCPAPGVSERLMTFSLVTHSWIKVTANADLDIMNRTLARREEILKFKDFYPQLASQKAKMDASFVEPANIWNT